MRASRIIERLVTTSEISRILKDKITGSYWDNACTFQPQEIKPKNLCA
jgi:hypothetical protein